jgi:hypothetical protein
MGRVLPLLLLCAWLTGCWIESAQVPPVGFLVADAPVEFLPLQVGLKAERLVTVRNHGGSMKVDSVAFESDPGPDLVLTSVFDLTCPSSEPVTRDKMRFGRLDCRFIALRYQPTQATTPPNAIVINYDNGQMPTVTRIPITFTQVTSPISICPEPKARVGIDPTLCFPTVPAPTLDFGASPYPKPDWREIGIYNSGPSLLHFTATVDGNAEAFVIDPLLDTSPINVGDRRLVKVTFQSSDAGPLAAALAIESNDPLYPRVEIPLVAAP